jgi:sugar phosphate isomerase/epimerase
MEVHMQQIGLSATSFPATPTLEYIDAAAGAGYDGLGVRLYRSPGLQNPFQPVVGDASLMHAVQRAIGAHGIEVWEIFSFYLQPELDLEAVLPVLAFGAELGARYALVIGDDPEWSRMRDHLGALCDVLAQFSMAAVLEAPLRRLSPLSVAVQLIQDAGRPNAFVSLDPLALARTGDGAEVVKAFDPGLFPYVQIDDGPEQTGPLRCVPGEGIAPLRELLSVLPAGLPVSVKWPAPADGRASAAEWAKHTLDLTRGFLKTTEPQRG